MDKHFYMFAVFPLNDFYLAGSWFKKQKQKKKKQKFDGKFN